MKPLFRRFIALVLTTSALMPMMLTPTAEAGPTPSLHCEGGGGNWNCVLFNAQRISWWVNGKHVPLFDGLKHAHGRCGLNDELTVKVSYAYGGSTGEKSRAVQCPREMP